MSSSTVTADITTAGPARTDASQKNSLSKSDMIKYVAIALACIAVGAAISSLISRDILTNTKISFDNNLSYWPEIDIPVMEATEAMASNLVIAASVSGVAALVFGITAAVLDRKSKAEKEKKSATEQMHDQWMMIGLAVATIAIGMFIGMAISRAVIEKIDLRSLVQEKSELVFGDFPFNDENLEILRLFFDEEFGLPLLKMQQSVITSITEKLLIAGSAGTALGAGVASYSYLKRQKEIDERLQPKPLEELSTS